MCRRRSVFGVYVVFCYVCTISSSKDTGCMDGFFGGAGRQVQQERLPIFKRIIEASHMGRVWMFPKVLFEPTKCCLSPPPALHTPCSLRHRENSKRQLFEVASASRGVLSTSPAFIERICGVFFIRLASTHTLGARGSAGSATRGQWMLSGKREVLMNRRQTWLSTCRRRAPRDGRWRRGQARR